MEMVDRQRECWKEWRESYYYNMEEQRMAEYRRETEERIEELQEPTMRQINKIILESAEKHLKTAHKKKITEKGVEKPPWMNNEIRDEIAKRRQKNKEHRNAQDAGTKRTLWKGYCEQKEKVQKLVKASIRKFEERTAEEIRNMKGGKQLWRMIEKLKSNGREKKQDTKLYTEEGEEVEEDKYDKVIKEFWEKIYRKNGNKMDEAWNQETQNEYREDLNKIKARERNPNEL